MVDQVVRTERVAGLSVLAAAGVVLVGYSYLFGLWTSRYGQSPDLLVTIRGWVNQPTGIGEDFGFLGVALLLVVAGYVLSESAAQRSPRQFLTLLGRTVLPVVVGAVLLSTVLVLVGATPLTEPAEPSLSFGAVFANLWLVPGLFGQPSLLGLNAPVTAALLFVLLLLAVRPLLRYPKIAAVVQLEVVGGLILLGGWSNEVDASSFLHSLGLVAGYLPLLLIGQLAWMFRSGGLNARFGVGFGVASLVLLVVHDRLFPELGGWWHPLSGAYAVLLMLIALPRGAAVAGKAPVRWLASRALPLFFSILVVGYAVLGLQRGWMPLVLAIPIAFAVAGLCAEGVHRAVGRLS
ncbi:hypothetical protein [Lentzea sp. NBRC 102530]|uniref:hypothetical protein n=1 Tax=Lentzea sp. NBRC 102530 TaxID=3032201 RepID=UPI0024A2060E|nr:hypothetical protein [Lentzea sp. NBRC 102530]GLY48174.1 hypothetical protein Lesp01_18300 [Lentzea sp. NBRC 102530]